MRCLKKGYRDLFLILLLAGTFGYVAQSQDKHRVRLKADYVKHMEDKSVLEIGATARINKQTVDLPGLELMVINEVGEEEFAIGTVQTNPKGEASLIIDVGALKVDSLGSYTLSVNYKGMDTLRRASRSISFRDADLIARLISRDSLHSIEAVLKDSARDSVLADQNVIVQVQRLFLPLLISEEINMTDENGTILVPIPGGIPGVEGVLKLEAVLADSDDYGTVKAMIEAPVGIPIVDESTFDERTLWAPRNKTPIFILLFTSILILATWGTILYLIRTLYKIAKH